METKLQASLQSLNDHLAQGEPVNEEFRSSFTRLDGDIQQVLARRAAATPDEVALSSEGLPEKPAETTTYGLAERTQELSAKFAAEHPKLEPALRELGNILSSMGI